MNTQCTLYLNTTRIDVVYKPIRNLYLRLHISAGTDEVCGHLSAPLGTPLETLRRFVESRTDWIQRQADKLAQRNIPLPEGFIQHLGQTVTVESLCGGIGERGRPAVLQAMRKRVLLEMLEHLILLWESRLGLKATGGWRTRRMKSRWGSCHPGKRSLCFNTELVRHAPECIEYVVVHELLHLRERGHGPAFWKLVADALPDWKQRRNRLNGR